MRWGVNSHMILLFRFTENTEIMNLTVEGWSSCIRSIYLQKLPKMTFSGVCRWHKTNWNNWKWSKWCYRCLQKWEEKAVEITSDYLNCSVCVQGFVKSFYSAADIVSRYHNCETKIDFINSIIMIKFFADLCIAPNLYLPFSASGVVQFFSYSQTFLLF